jgi:hypothetical protein
MHFSIKEEQVPPYRVCGFSEEAKNVLSIMVVRACFHCFSNSRHVSHHFNIVVATSHYKISNSMSKLSANYD